MQAAADAQAGALECSKPQSIAIVGTDVATGQAQKTSWFVGCSALRGVLLVVQVVQHCTRISASLIGFGHDGWSVQHAVQRC